MATYKTVSVDTHHLEVTYRYRPSGSHLLVFLHGMGCTLHSFDTAFDDPALKAYSLLSFDWPGHGQSGKPRRFDYQLEIQADVGLALLEQFSYKQVSLIGHSMGGGIGVLMAQRMPGLQAFASVEGSLLGGAFSQKIAQFSRQEYIAQGHRLLMRELQLHHEIAFQYWANWLAQADPSALHQLAQSMVQWAKSGELLARFNRLRRKAYLYSDSCDMRECLPRFRGARTQLIGSCGHFPMQDNPRELYQAIAQFLADR